MRKIYPRPFDNQTVYLKDVVSGTNIQAGDYTMYNDFVNDPRDFEKNNVLYHYPVNGDRLEIGKFCSIACGAKFLFTSANHALRSLSTYPFPIFFDEWELDAKDIRSAWDNKGDIIFGNDVWVGYEAVILSGVTIGDGAIIAANSVVTRDIPAYCVAGGNPCRVIRRRFDEALTEYLLTLRWWDWDAKKIFWNMDALCSGDLEKIKHIRD